MSTDYLLRATPTQRLKSAVLAELKGVATAHEVADLKRRENLVAWLRILSVVMRECESHIAKSRMNIANLKPSTGSTPSDEYLRAKKTIETQNIGRLHFLNIVKARRDEVSLLIAAEGLTKQTLGSVIAALVEVERILDEGNLQDAHDLVSLLIDAYERDESS